MKKILRSQKKRYQFRRHLITGASGVCFNYIATLFFSTYLSLNIFLSITTTHVFLISFIFFLQKNFTFSSRGKITPLFLRFIIFSFAYYLIDLSTTSYLVNSHHLDIWVAKAILHGGLTPISFLTQRLFIFK